MNVGEDREVKRQRPRSHLVGDRGERPVRTLLIQQEFHGSEGCWAGAEQHVCGQTGRLFLEPGSLHGYGQAAGRERLSQVCRFAARSCSLPAVTPAIASRRLPVCSAAKLLMSASRVSIGTRASPPRCAICPKDCSAVSCSSRSASACSTAWPNLTPEASTNRAVRRANNMMIRATKSPAASQPVAGQLQDCRHRQGGAPDRRHRNIQRRSSYDQKRAETESGRPCAVGCTDEHLLV